MTTEECIRARYSCRNYSAAVPAPELIDGVLDDARLAPSATNRQPWRFIVISPTDVEGRQAVAAAYSREWIETAPLYIIVCGMPADAWVRPFDQKNHIDVDLAIATEHICLGATARGLGSCWVCNFDPEVLSERLHLPAGLIPMAIIPIGYAADGAAAPGKKRKDLNEIVIRR